MHRTIITATMALALAGCGQRGGGEAGQGADKGPPPVNPANVSIATPEGRIDVRAGAGAVAGMPDGIPVYPGAVAAQGVEVSGAGPGGSGRILGFRTGDAPAQVIAFYADAAGRAHYTVTQQLSTGPTAMLIATRDGEMLNVSATRMGDVTQIQIVSGLGQ